ncbi:trefoil factor 1 precursor, partial [Daubentonia madagascariensis]
TCSMLPRERVNCGYPGVTRSECKSKGCCFDDTVSGFPWCFSPKAIDSPPE